MNKKTFTRVLGILSMILIVTMILSACAEETLSDYETMSKKEYKAACKEIPYDKLAREGNNIIGEKVKIYGKVIQMLAPDDGGTGYEYRIATSAGDYDIWLDDDISVFYDIEGKKKMLEDDFVTVYGEVTGDYTYETVQGGERTVPSLIVYYVDIE